MEKRDGAKAWQLPHLPLAVTEVQLLYGYHIGLREYYGLGGDNQYPTIEGCQQPD